MSFEQTKSRGLYLPVSEVTNLAQEIPRRCDSYVLNFSEKNFNAEKILKLYDNDALLQQAIDTPVEDSLSPWRDGVDYDKKYLIKEKVIEAIKQARLLRQVALLPVFKDRQGSFISFDKSLESVVEEGVSIEHFVMIKSFEAEDEIDNDLFSENFGKPKFYKTKSDKDVRIHHSRIVIVNGSRGRKSAAEGFIYFFSMFHDAYEEMIRATGESNVWTLGTNMEAIKNSYMDALDVGVETNGSMNKGNERRLENFRGSMNSRGAYMYDKDMEKVERNAVTNLDAIVKAVDMSLDVLCAAVDIVPSRYIGKSQGGLNSSNKSELANMVMIACNFRAHFAEPVLNKIDKMFSLVLDTEIPEYQWNPLKAEAFSDIKPLVMNESVA